MDCGIYKIENKINGKVYIGQSQDISERWKQHLNSYTKESNVIYKAIRKYGIDNFLFEIIEVCDIESLNEREIYYINKFNSYVGFKKSNGYNMTKGGEGTRGVIRSKEYRAAVRERLIGGRLSEETKLKISIHHKESGLFSGNNNPNFGKHWSEDWKINHSKKMKGKLSYGNNGMAKMVFCAGNVFTSAKECGEYYGIGETTIRGWLNGHGKINKLFEDYDLTYFENEDEILRYQSKDYIEFNIDTFNKYTRKKSSRRVVLNNILFDTILDCSMYANINISTMKSWLNGRNLGSKQAQHYINELGLRYATQEDIGFIIHIN